MDFEGIRFFEDINFYQNNLEPEAPGSIPIMDVVSHQPDI